MHRKPDDRTAWLSQDKMEQQENPFRKENPLDCKRQPVASSLHLLAKKGLILYGKQFYDLSMPRSPLALRQGSLRQDHHSSIQFYSNNFLQTKPTNSSIYKTTAELHIDKKLLTPPPFTDAQNHLTNGTLKSCQFTALKIKKDKPMYQKCAFGKVNREALPFFREKLKLKLGYSNTEPQNISFQLLTQSRLRNSIQRQCRTNSLQPRLMSNSKAFMSNSKAFMSNSKAFMGSSKAFMSNSKAFMGSSKGFKHVQAVKSPPYVAALQKLKAHQTAVDIKRGFGIYHFQSRVNQLDFLRHRSIHSSAEVLRCDKTDQPKGHRQKPRGERKRVNSLDEPDVKRGLKCMEERRKGVILKVDTRYEHADRIKSAAKRALEEVARSYFFGKEIMEGLQRVNIQTRNLQSAMESDCILYQSTQKHAAARECREGQGKRRIELQHARRMESLRSKQLKLDGNGGRVAKIVTTKQFQ